MTNKKYSFTAMFFHWFLAIVIFTLLASGFYMEDLPFSMQKLKLINWHKWLGMTFLFLTVLRLTWRFIKKPPELSKEIIEKMGKAQFFAFKMTHFLMYALFFIIPLSGWIYSSLAGFPIVVFGVLPIPDLVTPNKELADAIKPIHAIGAWSLVILIVLHVGAALKHQFIDKDNLISRMNPFSKK